jgi:hypothetical protein
MPQIAPDMEAHKVQGGTFNYSATRIGELGATEYTLATIVNDVSGSVSPFKAEMEAALKEAVQSCKLSPRADNLMIRHVKFNDSVDEGHGFKLLSSAQPSDYDNKLNPMGGTALYDGTLNAIEATKDYAKQLVDASYAVNGVIFIVTDGDNNSGIATVGQVKKAIEDIQRDEKLESLVTILIGVNINDTYMKQKLEDFKRDAGITQYVELGSANKSSLAKLAAFISKSISAQSQALGTGGPSKQLTSGSLTI